MNGVKKDIRIKKIYKKLKKSNLDLSYTRNSLYYKERIRKNNKLTYKYYDIKTNEEVFTSVLGGSNEWDRKYIKRKTNCITKIFI